MNLWSQAFDELGAVSDEEMTRTDHKLKRAEILALLAIGQELSLIRHQGINPEFDSSGD